MTGNSHSYSGGRYRPFRRSLCNNYRNGMQCHGKDDGTCKDDHRECRDGSDCPRKATTCHFGHPPFPGPPHPPPSVMVTAVPAQPANSRSASARGSSAPPMNGGTAPPQVSHQPQNVRIIYETAPAPQPQQPTPQALPPMMHQPPPYAQHMPQPPPQYGYMPYMHGPQGYMPGMPPPHPHMQQVYQPQGYAMAGAVPMQGGMNTMGVGAYAAGMPRARLVIEGAHLDAALYQFSETHGGFLPSMKRVVQELERHFRVRFVKKTLHQGTRHGELNQFHKRLQSASDCGIQCITKPKRAQAGSVVAGNEGEKVLVWVEKGVEMAIAMDLISPPKQGKEEANHILLITGDPELEHACALASSSNIVIVCSLERFIAPGLLPYTRHYADGSRGIWLEDILEAAFVGKKERAYPYVPEDQSSQWSGNSSTTNKAPSTSKPRGRARCDKGKACPDYDEKNHRRTYLHPCRDGVQCQHIQGPDNKHNKTRKYHQLDYLHPCSRGEACPDQNSEKHSEQFYHAEKPSRQVCPNGFKCDKLKKGKADAEHINSFVHPCPFKVDSCSTAKNPKTAEVHKQQFTHPCDASCALYQEKEWNTEHCRMFHHNVESKQEEGQGGEAAAEAKEVIEAVAALEGLHIENSAGDTTTEGGSEPASPVDGRFEMNGTGDDMGEKGPYQNQQALNLSKMPWYDLDRPSVYDLTEEQFYDVFGMSAQEFDSLTVLEQLARKTEVGVW